jgi:hypothetical protein
MPSNLNLLDRTKQWTMIEILLGAISRLPDFAALTESEVKSHENEVPEALWPEDGATSIKGFSASYSETSKLVLKDITLDIGAGEALVSILTPAPYTKRRPRRVQRLHNHLGSVSARENLSISTGSHA